jgi:hypothetical protein
MVALRLWKERTRDAAFGGCAPGLGHRYGRDGGDPVSVRRLWIGAGVLLVSALIAGYSFYEWRPDFGVSLSETSVPAEAIAPALSQRIEPPTTQTETVVPGVDAYRSEKPLPLQLIATNPGRNHREGSASIGTTAASAQTHSTGGLLSNGARLVEVHTDRVLIERGGKRAFLFLARHSSSQARANDVAMQQILLVGGPDARGEQVKPPVVPALHTAIRAQPVFSNDRVSGVRFDPGQRRELFVALGFEAGDVVVAFNGEPISAADRVSSLMRALESGAPVSLTLDRNGHLHYISLQARAFDEAGASHAVAAVQVPSENMPTRQ